MPDQQQQQQQQLAERRVCRLCKTWHGVLEPLPCQRCGHHHREGRPSGSTICDVQIAHEGADADTNRYCTCREWIGCLQHV